MQQLNIHRNLAEFSRFQIRYRSNSPLNKTTPTPSTPQQKLDFKSPVGAYHDTPLRLVVYDILGKEVATLVNEPLAPGSYEVNFDAGNLTSGLYFYKLTSGTFTETKKMVLLK